MVTVRSKIYISTAIVFALLAAYFLRSSELTSKIFGSADSKTSSKLSGTPTEPSETTKLDTRFHDRLETSDPATHSPERLRNFYLPALSIEGETLDQALETLREAYEKTCLETGEVPLRLTFDLPPENFRKIHLRLAGKDFNSAVNLLAALSGMKVGRQGSVYQFENVSEVLKPVNRRLQVSPDIIDRLNDLTPKAADKHLLPKQELNEIFNELGLTLDPSTVILMDGVGTLILETDHAADFSAISQTIDTLQSQPPIQLKYVPKQVNLPAGTDFEIPDVAEMANEELMLFMRDLSQAEGTDMHSLPSVAMRNGENADIEIVREIIAPTDASLTEFETHKIGKVLNLQGSALGFGQETTFRYNETSADFEESPEKLTIVNETDISDTQFTNDQGTRLVVQTRPDGTKTIVLLTATLTDVTGRPINGQQ